MQTGSISTKAQSVLVVDDDPFSQDLLREILNSLGVEQIYCANNGIEGMRSLSRLNCRPDLLICDVFMPDMDGFEFLNKLGQLNYSGGVILVSGGNLEMLQIAKDVALADGINLKGAYPKPVSSSILKQAITQACVH
jgi:CheY-like chemotaxis protein